MQTRTPFWRLFTAVLIAAAVLLITACRPAAGTESVDLPRVLKGVQSAPGGWKPQAEARLYTPDNLFDLMNGQSDAFFVYGFQKAAVQRFTGDGGSELMAVVFQVDASDSAFGLFSANQDALPVEIGSGGSTSPGQRLSFWQERYFVQLTGIRPVADDILRAAAETISASLPKGGETPALMGWLPQNALLQEPAPIFFHQELSIQDRVWLGGENLLGLGPETDGVLAAYDMDGERAWLMLVAYPDSAGAGKALEALSASKAGEFLSGGVKGSLLVAVFGQIDPAAAQGLLQEALDRAPEGDAK